MNRTGYSVFHLRGVRISSLILLVLVATSARAARHERIVNSWKPINYSVRLTFDDQLTQLTSARTEITIEVLGSSLNVVDLDFGELEIDSVVIDGVVAEYDRTKELLNIHVPRPARRGDHLVVAVEYHGKPKDGLTLTNDKDGKPSATGDNWPNRVHHWIPSLDHPSAKAPVTFSITAPARDLVVANGQMVEIKDNAGGNRTWTYTEAVPIPAYCMVVAVGEYASFSPTQPAVTPLSFYVPQSDANVAVLGFSSAAATVKLFSETIDRYPYEKLALIVGATRFGGMENSSAIVFASNVLDMKAGAQRMSRIYNIPERLEDVVAHEIAHQWFGDSVTESTWSDLWLSEGFATYFAGLFLERNDGEQAFRDYMKRAADAYLSFEKRTNIPIHDTESENLMSLLNANNYQKGAWVLHMLRAQVGDESFFKGLQLYYSSHKNSNANSDDLRQALEKTSGKNLKPFFADWIFGTGHPVYAIGWQPKGSRRIQFTLKQTQIQQAFVNSVPVEIVTDKGRRLVTFTPTSKMTTKSLQIDGRIISVTIDPENTILKE